MAKKTLSFIILLFVIFFAFPLKAETFVIKNYNIDINVDINNIAHVNESISAYFSTASHGIVREINHNEGIISNININNPYYVSDINNKTNIKIGSQSQLVEGLQNYNISYDYEILDNKNEFYYNIVGFEWPVEIEKVTFRIVMPKEFDPSKVGISIGQYGTRGFNGNSKYTIDGNVITGETFNTLLPNYGITIRIELPKGYYIKKNQPQAKLITFIILFITFFSFIIWFKFGKDDHITPIISFHQPKNIFLSDIEQIYNEKTTTKTLVAMIISLAHRGYIKIKQGNKPNDFILQKTKSYDGEDDAEAWIIDAIFGNSGHVGTSVNREELERFKSYGPQCQMILQYIEDNKKRYFTSHSIDWILRFIMLLFPVIILTCLIYSLSHYSITIELPYFLGGLIITTIALLVLPIQYKICIIILGTIFYISNFNTYIKNTNFMQIIESIIGLIITITCYIQLPKLNYTGIFAKRQLLGLKRFIEVAEKKRLETLVSENPEYFYDILPYAYVLDVSDKWIKQFEKIIIIKPDWYYGNMKSLNILHKFLHNTTDTCISISQAKSFTNSNGYGGFAGGGHGGGGGHSW